MPFTPPVQRGLHLTVEDDHFRIAVSIRNMTSDDVTLRTMDSSLFNPVLKERTFSEDGIVPLWSRHAGALQAVTTWSLPPESTTTRHYDVPSESMARERAQKCVEDFEHCNDVENVMSGPDFAYVEPEDVGVLQVVSTFPAIAGYHDSLTRQFDLRGPRWQESLDHELPAEQTTVETLNY